MPKLRKVKRRQKYRYPNRASLRKKNKGRAAVTSTRIRSAWDDKKSVVANMRDMGLAYDANTIMKMPKSIHEGYFSTTEEEKKPTSHEGEVREKMIVDELEEEAKANVNTVKVRVGPKQLPPRVVSRAIYLIKKYRDDYKAMAKDHKNYYQESWKQIRRKIQEFKKLYELKENKWKLKEVECESKS